jgi:phosphohistidine phosphatase
MKVLLIRHAHAADQDRALPDAARHLTRRGRDLARRLGARLRAEGIVFDALVSSPLVRAVQTAELVAQGAGYEGEVSALPALAPDGSPHRVAADLEGVGAAVAVVGHEPSISHLAAVLLGRASHAAFKKGQLVIIVDGKVAATIDPETL